MCINFVVMFCCMLYQSSVSVFCISLLCQSSVQLCVTLCTCVCMYYYYYVIVIMIIVFLTLLCLILGTSHELYYYKSTYLWSVGMC